ncbi:Nuclear pore complex protein NUP98A [Camellia lanceoleosa]|uniref:Nuclear pore complex protein NUP98A n=1 Tax=Camellia lanceoleosa TaxID=1840588 RepID=A0ACC0HNR1_9ERIC|nr:Nuclear pore complex protein NUP98A [Camellia lanceoleosa]
MRLDQEMVGLGMRLDPLQKAHLRQRSGDERTRDCCSGLPQRRVVDKPAPVRISSLLTSRHLSQRRIRLPARKYHPKNDGPKVPFFTDDEETPSTPRADALFIPRENPRALVLKFLMERNNINALHGQITIGTLILQDCAVGLLFALLPVLGGTSGVIQGVISMTKLYGDGEPTDNSARFYKWFSEGKGERNGLIFRTECLALATGNMIISTRSGFHFISCFALTFSSQDYTGASYGLDVVTTIASIPTYRPGERIHQYNDLAQLGDERAKTRSGNLEQASQDYLY